MARPHSPTLAAALYRVLSRAEHPLTLPDLYTKLRRARPGIIVALERALDERVIIAVRFVRRGGETAYTTRDKFFRYDAAGLIGPEPETRRVNLRDWVREY